MIVGMPRSFTLFSFHGPHSALQGSAYMAAMNKNTSARVLQSK